MKEIHNKLNCVIKTNKDMNMSNNHLMRRLFDMIE